VTTFIFWVPSVDLSHRHLWRLTKYDYFDQILYLIYQKLHYSYLIRVHRKVIQCCQHNCVWSVDVQDTINAVGVGDVVEYAESLITRVRLVSPIDGATGGSGNLSTSLSNIARLAAHVGFQRQLTL
jgi:hypothetical protein